MTEASNITSDLMLIRTTLTTTAQRLVAAVEQLDGLAPAARVPEGDVAALAEQCARMDALHVGVARKMCAVRVAEALDIAEVARCVDHSDLASNLCMSDVADAIDLSNLAQEMLNDVSVSNVAKRVAQRFTAKEVADEMSASDVASEIDTEAVAAHMWDIMYEGQKDRLAEAMVTVMMNRAVSMPALATALCRQPAFVQAVAQAVADAVTGRVSDPEPHGSRDTFVPAPSEGPDGEAYNAMQS